eukprot:5355865-Amphidinium_carterae.1
MSDANIRFAAGHIKPFRSPPLTVLGDGLTTDQAEILQRLREAWVPIHEPATLPDLPHPMLTSFLPAPTSPTALPPLTAELLHSTLTAMQSRTSSGPDGWRVAELQFLLKLRPHDLSSDLLRMFQHFEQHAHSWPKSMHMAWVSPIPKSGPKNAFNVRPIAVYGVLYRLWASVRFRTLDAWLETCLARQQSAYRSQRSAEKEAFRFLSHLEAHQSAPMYGILPGGASGPPSHRAAAWRRAMPSA